jgi:hypothetical protein
MPARLVDASKERVTDKITESEYQKRLEDRERWQMYRVSGDDVLDKDGQPKAHRFECPVRGAVGPLPARETNRASLAPTGGPNFPLPRCR